METVYSVTKNPVDIEGRQKLIKFLVSNRDFLEKLLIDVKNIKFVYEEYLVSKRMVMASLYINSNDRFNVALGTMQTNAVALEKVLRILKHIFVVLEECKADIVFINEIKRVLRAIFENKHYEEMLCLIQRLSSFEIEENIINVLMELDSSGKLSNSQLILTGYKRVERNKKVALSESEKSIVFGKAIENITHTLKEYIKSLCDDFIPLYDELLFYNVAVRFCEFLSDNNCVFCYPKISDCVNIVGLKDACLLSSKNNENIVKNDFVLKEQQSVIVVGENASGKTVYLRSVFTALLFGFAGLPILADEATIKPYANIEILFSSKDNNFDTLVGRFENEVKTLSELYYNIEPDSILFLNEIMQSTSYEEAEPSFADILTSLLKRNVQCIVVTHLKNLYNYLPEENFKKLTTVNDGNLRYKIVGCD